ncbi:RyR domain-containing protein [Haloferula sp. A504]|uniref:RyR domain-containing protein n=1 Tax=Haloferula sp. A504 TaxID=3373601 RepID=UPI0031C3B936|nr:RyR domain-containing protein [Verrucomicrobiaceae bacterium E54]
MSEERVPRRVVVTGDRLTDFHLVQYPEAEGSYASAGNKAFLNKSPGGADFLAKLLGKVCGRLDADVLGPAAMAKAARRKNKPSEAFQVWARFDKTWRVREFLGCRLGESGAPDVPELGAGDVLVVENLGLDFSHDAAAWRQLRERAKGCGSILVKTSVVDPCSPLLREFAPECAERLTVVLSASALRDAGERLSEGSSWDSTIEDLLRALWGEGVLGQLARCRRVIVRFGLSGVGIVSRDPADLAYQASAGEGLWERGRLVRFLYHPECHEGVYDDQFPGMIFGAGSYLTAGVVLNTLAPESYPLFIAASRALGAGRAALETGGGEEAAGPRVGEVLPEPLAKAFAPEEEKPEPGKKPEPKPEEMFRCAFPEIEEEGTGDRYGYGPVDPHEEGEPTCHILRDAAGDQEEAVAALATEVILRGAEAALDDIPKVHFGAYLTVDREEIERINAFRRAVRAYQENSKDTRPLSIAVFGPPGSGKSFAIKQLMNSLFGGKKQSITFNMSQFRDEEELYEALHQVRDETIRGNLPLIFFDEFDSNFGGEFGWLKYFLAPMQDAEFWDGRAMHPLGKAIFVFAGGKCESFEAFDQRNEHGGYDSGLRNAKVPDFISRLRGYLDIKGPNAITELDRTIGIHRIRRAGIVRHMIETHCGSVIDPKSKFAKVGLDVVRAFLFAEKFLHGARSIEALVSTSRVCGAGWFTRNSLPTPDVIRLHVTEDFLDPPQPELSDPYVIERIAEATHESWMTAKMEKDNYRYGARRNDDLAKGPLTHPLLKDYSELSEGEKDGNRKPARLLLVKAQLAGLELERTVPRSAGERPPDKVDEGLAMAEHDFWVRDHLIRGYQHCDETTDELRLHRSLQPFATLTEADKLLDEAIVRAMHSVLDEMGYRLVPGVPPEPCGGD